MTMFADLNNVSSALFLGVFISLVIMIIMIWPFLKWSRKHTDWLKLELCELVVLFCQVFSVHLNTTFVPPLA